MGREGDMKVDDWTGVWSVGRGRRFTNAQGGGGGRNGLAMVTDFD